MALPTAPRRVRGHARALAATLLPWLLTFAQGQDAPFVHDPIWRGEAAIATGIEAHLREGDLRLQVALQLRGRLEVEASLGTDGQARAVLAPHLAAGPGPTDLRFHPGVQEAFVRLRLPDLDLSAGFERLPLTQMRLLEPVSLEPRSSAGEPRGPLGVRAGLYRSDWRVRTALLFPTGDDLLPDGLGAAASLRYDRPAVTVEAHAAWTERPVAGLTASTSLGSVVAYGEAWLLADPVRGRGGVGATGHAGDWSWTAEAGWVAPAGTLRTEAAPALAGRTSRALGPDASLDATLAASWPVSADEPGHRVTTLAITASWRQDVGDDTALTVTPSLRLAERSLAGAVGVSVEAYY